MAELLAADGWNIGFCDLDEKVVAAQAGILRTKGSKEVYGYVLDVADYHAYATVVEKYLAASGGVDLLVNNAGVGDGGPFVDYSLENWHWLIGINLMGVIHGCKLFMPALIKSKGAILNVSSAAAFATAQRMAPYNVAKAGVLALSETLCAELYPDGIVVSCLMPTFFPTNVMQHARGGKQAVEMGTHMMGISKLTADEVARQAFEGVASKRLYIVVPSQARFIFRLRNLFPRWFMRKKQQMALKQEAFDAKVKAQYERVKAERAN